MPLRSVAFVKHQRYNILIQGWVGPASYYAEKYNTVADNTSTRYTSFKNDSRCIFNKSPRFTKSRQEQNR